MGIYSNSANDENLKISKIISGYDNKEEKKQILWIDQNIDNLENKFTIEYLQKELKDDYNITTLKSVSEAFYLLEIKKELFSFRLFYVIVSGRLAEEYFNNYAEKVINMNILSASIIYCYNDSYHKKKTIKKIHF